MPNIWVNATPTSSGLVSPFDYINMANTCTGTTTNTFTTIGSGGGGGTSSNTFIGETAISMEDYMNNKEYFDLAIARGVRFRIRTQEEERRVREATERAIQEQQRRLAERAQADIKAKRLLFSYLTPEQQDTFERNNWFIVVGGISKRKYRIRTKHGLNANIDLLRKDKDIVEALLCCHCSHDIPDCDQYLAQKVSLEYDETDFLRIANRRAA